jgi:hypothetical protein
VIRQRLLMTILRQRWLLEALLIYEQAAYYAAVQQYL